jgi:endogenous inhibitor of DNA gyrase (YacG/DUF329 family)
MSNFVKCPSCGKETELVPFEPNVARTCSLPVLMFEDEIKKLNEWMHNRNVIIGAGLDDINIADLVLFRFMVANGLFEKGTA